MADEKGIVKENFDDTLTMKMYKFDLADFKMKCAKADKSYTTTLREIIRAFNEDRIKIIPTDEQKASLKIYQQ